MCEQLVEGVTYTIQNKHNRRISKGSAGLDPSIPAFKRLQTYAVDCTAIDTDYHILSSTKSTIISHSSLSTQQAGFRTGFQEVAGYILASDTGFPH
jgi:hypothetical protein